MARKKRPGGKRVKKKVCRFCRDNVEYVDYKDLATLKPFLNERAKIKARRTTGSCAQHQKQVSLAIKNAREMSLLPYSVR